MHLAIDPDMNIHAIEITGTDVSDSEGMDRILPMDLAIDRVIADGAYYSIERGEALNDRGIVAVIPPPSHAVVHGDENTKLHDQTVQYIKDQGSIYAFHKKYGYGLRALVEAQISRIKRCIGAKLLTQKLESQKCEALSSPTSSTRGIHSADPFSSKMHSCVRSAESLTLPNKADRERIVADVFAHAVQFAREAVVFHANAEDDDYKPLLEDLSNLADDLTCFLLGTPGHFPDRLSL